MKIISNALKEVLKKDIVTERDYIILTGTTDRIYLWFKLYDDCYKDGNILQNFIIKRFEFEYFDKDIDFRKKEFKAYKEYKLEDGTWEAIDYGTFIVADVEESDTKEKVKVTAYDYALKFANVYVTELDYTNGDVTLLDVWNEACAKCGVETDLTSFTNSDFIVDSNQFEETAQFGNVISAISGVSGNFAKIVDDKVKLIFTKETDVIIEKNEYDEFEDKRDTHPITIVGLGMSNIDGENVVERWEDGIVAYGENYMMINDNPFAYTQDKRQQLLPALYNKLKGFAYSAVILKNCLHPELECGDLIKVRNSAGQLIETIVLRPAYEATNIKLEAPSITKAIVEYSNPASALTIAKRTEIIVNKQEQVITSLVEEQTQFEYKVTENLQNIEGWEFKIQQTGGENLLPNSTLEYGLGENHTYTGDIEVVTEVEIKKKTLSKSAIKIANGSLKTNEIDIIPGQEYVHSLLIYKNELTNVTVTINSDKTEIYNIECEPYTWQQLSFNVLSNSNKVTLEIEADDSYILISDRMLNKGEEPLQWQRFAGEIVTDTIKINNRGLICENSTEDTTTRIDRFGFFVINKGTNEIETTINKDLTDMNKGRIRKQFNIGKLRTTVLDNGDIIESWDD